MTGIAWYRREQWARLREVAADADVLEKTYEEWQTLAERLISDFAKQGVSAGAVDTDVEELVDWCRAQDHPINQSARAPGRLSRHGDHLPRTAEPAYQAEGGGPVPGHPGLCRSRTRTAGCRPHLPEGGNDVLDRWGQGWLLLEGPVRVGKGVPPGTTSSMIHGHVQRCHREDR